MADYYFFIDETGDHGLSFVDPNFPLFLLSGCLFNNIELQKIEKGLSSLKMRFFKSETVILHSREIRKCEGAFQVLFDLKIKEQFYKSLNSTISTSNFKLIGSGVNKEEHIKKYGKGATDPYPLSLAFIIERLIFCLDKLDRNSKVHIKIEKRGRKEDQQLLDQYNTILDKGTYFVNPERLKTKINSFEFFLKHDNILGLQVADLCAYPLARHVLNPKEPYIPFTILETKIYCDGNGKYDGYGLKVFP